VKVRLALPLAVVGFGILMCRGSQADDAADMHWYREV